MKIAVIHEWLTTVAGSERVLEEILKCYPSADLFCTVDFLGQEEREWLRGRRIKTTFIQRMPFAKSSYRQYLPLMPLAVEQHDLGGYDIILSSNHAVAKGVITGPDQLHISYVHSPMRYAWDLQHQYLRESGLERGIRSYLTRWILHRMRIWDSRTGNGVDEFVANSRFVARRIKKVHRRDAQVIYPPVDVDAFTPCEDKDDYYLAASRMVPYKQIGTIVEAFAHLPERRLVVVGDGPEYERIRGRAGSNVSFTGYQPKQALVNWMQHAKAFVFAAEEDFGIMPVEAQACGTPVIGYCRGGVAETVRGLEASEPTGVLFAEKNARAIADAVKLFESESTRILGAACRKNAERFGQRRFRAELMAFVDGSWNRFVADR